MIIKTPNEELNRYIGGGIRGSTTVFIYGDSYEDARDVLWYWEKFVSVGCVTSYISPADTGGLIGSISGDPGSFKVYDRNFPVSTMFTSNIVFVDEYDIIRRTFGFNVDDWNRESAHACVPVVLGVREAKVSGLQYCADVIFKARGNGDLRHKSVRIIRNKYGPVGGVYHLSFDQDHKDDHAGMIYNEYNKTWSFGII